jgi:hypothetical protein
MASDFDEYAGYPEDTHKIHAGQSLNPGTYTFYLENGKQYTCSGNTYINTNNGRKLAEDIEENDEIDDTWLQKQGIK